MKPVTLKAGREKPVNNRHHWIFSKAVGQFPKFENGDILPVVSATGAHLGHGYFHRDLSLVGRMVSFGAADPLETIKGSLQTAVKLRRNLASSDTDAYRLVHGEADLLPGLVVDQYADVLVMQISTLGMDRLRSTIVESLVDLCHPKMIFERSVGPSRRMEGLADEVKLLYGQEISKVRIREAGLAYEVDIKDGQKTGFFLDHRAMRAQVSELSVNRRVLNAFAYTGGFTVAALKGGAQTTTTVDISEPAIEQAKINVGINGFDVSKQSFHAVDVFEFLRSEPLDYDLVILDPPAFAKKEKDVVKACRGYKDINRLAMQKMPKESLLLTASCSYHVDASLFQKVLFQAAHEAKRDVRIIGMHRLAFDHPTNIYHPETAYLKSFLLYLA